MQNEIWIYVEHHLGSIQPVTYQLISKALKIKGDKKVVAVLLESNEENLEEDLKTYGPDEIIVFKDPKLANQVDSTIAELLRQLVTLRSPNSILFGATVVGRSVSARLQAKLQTGLTADCLDLKYEGDLLVQIKPSYGDNIMCEIVCPDKRPQMASVRPNIFKALEFKNKNLKITTLKDLKIKTIDDIKIKEERVLLSKSDSIKNADRVIAIGRGANSKETISLAKELAFKLGAKIGVTRPLTSEEPFTVDDQIGQSGNTIAPKFLLNLGISGAVQFTAGIHNAQVIVSVNINKNAPIFDVSDYFYIGDSKEFLEEFLKTIQ